MLSLGDRLTLETSKMIREDFLQQNAFVDVDSYSSYERQSILLQMILDYDSLCRAAMEQGADLNRLIKITAREQIGRAKYVPENEYRETYKRIGEDMKAQISEISAGGEEL